VHKKKKRNFFPPFLICSLNLSPNVCSNQDDVLPPCVILARNVYDGWRIAKGSDQKHI
jgi:hypothetical protein